MIKTILKVKKPTVTMSIPPPVPMATPLPVDTPVPVATPLPVAAPVPEKKKTILKVKKPTVAMAMPKPLDPEPVQAKKIILKLKKKVPPPPAPGVYVTKAMEAFEADPKVGAVVITGSAKSFAGSYATQRRAFPF